VTKIVFELRGGPLAPHLARGRLPRDLLPYPRAAVLELLLSELVSNAVRHGGVGGAEIMKVAVLRASEYVAVSVTNPGPGFDWHGREDGRGLHTGGFGLLLVDRLASRWGIDRVGESTTVWFELD
jgi:anti-sigma regulatory factor (Ser/Thr protein kinase)